MKNVSRLIPLLSGIVTLSGCNHAPQKNNGQNSQKPIIIYIFAEEANSCLTTESTNTNR